VFFAEHHRWVYNNQEMQEFQAKKRFRKYLYSKATIAVVIILIGFFAKATWNVYQKEQDSSAQAARADMELKRLEERQTLLTGELQRLGTKEGLEEEIRSKYSVSKPGEQVVIIVDPAQSEKATTTPQNQSWWDKIKSWFK
jgi:cell division protein FtsB